VFFKIEQKSSSYNFFGTSHPLNFLNAVIIPIIYTPLSPTSHPLLNNNTYSIMARPARAPRTGTAVCWAPLLEDLEEADLEAEEAAELATEAALDEALEAMLEAPLAADAALEVALEAAEPALEAALDVADIVIPDMLVEDCAAAKPARAGRTK